MPASVPPAGRKPATYGCARLVRAVGGACAEVANRATTGVDEHVRGGAHDRRGIAGMLAALIVAIVAWSAIGALVGRIAARRRTRAAVPGDDGR